MAKKQTINPKIVEKAYMQPTVYVFDLQDVPMDMYMEVLDILFHNPDFKAAVEKRNRLVKSSGRMRSNSPEILNMLRTIQQHDRKLADTIFECMVQANLHSPECKEHIPFSTLLKYHVDYSREGISETVTRLASNLDKVTFLSEMLEHILTDIHRDMDVVFDGKVKFQQFDGVKSVLTQLRGFFNDTRSNDLFSPEGLLYSGYAVSINKYLDKRLKTYTDKYRKIHPAPPQYTMQDMITALNQFFGTDKFFGPNFIKRTASGGCYIDAVAVAFNLTQEQTAKLDGHVMQVPQEKSAEASFQYSLAVTDVIMKEYRKA